MRETKLVKSSHIAFQSVAKIIDVVRELTSVELRGDEDEMSGKEEETQINGHGDLGGQPPQDPK